MTTISLCVIAQDAAPNLPDCIRSTAGLVTEIIVLDTGNLNGSGEWAVSNGAKMIPYQWTGDMAEARTVAARQATGDWVLVLDSNEQLSEGGDAIIRAAVEAGGLDCGYLPLIHVKRTGSDPSQMDDDKLMRIPRLLRRTVDLRWDEGEPESVNGWIAMRARRVRVIDAPIVKAEEPLVVEAPPVRVSESSGAALDETEVVYVAPGQQAPTPAQVQPEDAAINIDDLIVHAWERYHDDDLDGARTAVETMWGHIHGEHPEVVQVITLRAHIQILDGQEREALGTIGQALEWGVHHPNMDMLQGVIAESAGMGSIERGHHLECMERAETAFLAAASYDGEISARDSLPGVTSWAANTRLGTVRLMRGDVDGASLAFEAALEADPEHAEASMGLMECWLEQGDGAKILEPIMPYMEANIADAWMLAAAACEEMGRIEDALLFVSRAHELKENGLQASAHRNHRYLELLSMAGLYGGHPISGPGPWGALGALVSRQPLPSIATPAPVDGPKTVRLVTHCVSAGWNDVVEALLEPRAEQVAPGIGDVVRRTLSALGAESVPAALRAPIFVGGAWDSGVRTLQGMLDAHSGMEAGEETKLIPILCSLRNEWWDGMSEDLEVAGIGEKQLDQAVRGFIQGLLDGASPSKTLRSVETTPHTLLHLETMARIYPQARFIHVVRDGRDVVASLLQREWMDPATGEKVWCCQSPEAGAEYWVHVVDAIRKQGARFPDRYLEIRYEDLVAHPVVVMRHVLAFLGERWEPSVVDEIQVEPTIDLSDASGIDVAIADQSSVIFAQASSEENTHSGK
jgi:tetratricopeptide (TPR) repeat protein